MKILTNYAEFRLHFGKIQNKTIFVNSPSEGKIRKQIDWKILQLCKRGQVIMVNFKETVKLFITFL